MSQPLPTRLPDNAAGRRCMDVVRHYAKKLCDIGNAATGELIQAHFPAARTINKDYADRKFKHTVEREDGEHITVIYDYETQETTVAG